MKPPEKQALGNPLQQPNIIWMQWKKGKQKSTKKGAAKGSKKGKQPADFELDEALRRDGIDPNEISEYAEVDFFSEPDDQLDQLWTTLPQT